MKLHMESVFKADPRQAIRIEFRPEGMTMLGGKPWVAKLRFPIGSKTGWAAESLAELLTAIEENAP